MNKQFIPYEQALKLKELGFNEECLAIYCKDGNLTALFQPDEKEENYPIFFTETNISLPIYCIAAPLWQQAFDFFREKYDLHSYIKIGKNSDYILVVNDIKDSWDTYQEAQQACLERLIEIVETKNK